MSSTQFNDSSFPDSRNPVRMDTEDQSFAGKHSHGTHNTNKGESTFTEVMPLSSAPLVHHVHRDDEPLPGARGGAQTFDYSPENIDKLPTGAGNTTGGNTARAYGGSTTEASGDFRGPTISSTNDRHDLSSGLNHGTGTHTGTGTGAGAAGFASGKNDHDLFSGSNTAGSGLTHDLHNSSNNTHNTHNTHGTHGTNNTAPGHVSQPVSDPKPHTGTNNASIGRTDNYNTVSSTGHNNNTMHQQTPYDGAGNEPTNKASIADKIVGKTEQIAGKIANNPGLQEKGEIRKAGLKN